MYIASRGGSGGKGNHYFVEDTLQVPRFAQYGAEGEIRSLILELKVIAQVGLVCPLPRYKLYRDMRSVQK